MLLKQAALYTDFYELTMAQGYFLSGRSEEQASFDYFFRSLPFDGGYVVFAGISDLLRHIAELRFHEDDIEYLKEQGFRQEFLDYLKDFRFKGHIQSVREGEVVFPQEPTVRVEGTLIETQIVETLLLNLLNFESLIATKACRLRHAAGSRKVVDFGLRRAQGFGGIHGSKAAVIGGLDATSNVYSAKNFGLPVSGTMAHSWVQSFESELEAFRKYASFYPDSTVLLVDTYDTLKRGIPNAIKVGKELEENGHRLLGIRLDSGDLAYLAKKSRKMLDDAGLDYVNIAASNQLDEYLIRSLIEQKAPIDFFGVGTRLATSYDDPALNGVYKLAVIDGEPTLKVSDNIEKITMPGRKMIRRYFNEDGTFHADGISLDYEGEPELIIHPFFPLKQTEVKNLKFSELLHPVMKDGEILDIEEDVEAISNYRSSQFKLLNEEHKRFDNPHVYKVGISKGLMDLRNSYMKT
jgi:nicotinate phosphoribosyltransferase